MLRLASSAILSGTSGNEPFAVIDHANLALGIGPTPRGSAAASRLILWSGWFGRPADPVRGRFPRDFRTWTPAAWEALDAACDGLLPALAERGIELCLRPHARHVLSDPQACLSFLRKHEGVRLLLDPASFMTGSMLDRAEDHVARMFEALGDHPAVAGVVLANVLRNDPDDEDSLGPAPLHRGLIEPRLLVNACRTHCPPGLHCALPEAEFDAQAAMLAAM